MKPVWRAPAEDNTLTSAELRQYWRRLHADEQLSSDLERLSVVCHPGAPLWFNRYFARLQLKAFRRALAYCGNIAGARALDVGCGTGRWSALLDGLGARAVGIDVSEEVILENRHRMPSVEFIVSDILEFEDREMFELAVSVTVLQHLSFDEQTRAAEKLANLVKPHGHLLILENIQDQGQHVFARSVSGWTNAFASRGFKKIHHEGYEYDLAIRAVRLLVAPIWSLVRRTRHHQPLPLASQPWGIGRRLAFRPLVWFSEISEQILGPFLPDDRATHCAIVFVRQPA